MASEFIGDFCVPDDDPEWEAFCDQLPLARSDYLAPRCESVREEEPWPALKASQLFDMWQGTRKLYTRRASGRWTYIPQEMVALLEAQQTSESLAPPALISVMPIWMLLLRFSTSVAYGIISHGTSCLQPPRPTYSDPCAVFLHFTMRSSIIRERA